MLTSRSSEWRYVSHRLLRFATAAVAPVRSIAHASVVRPLRATALKTRFLIYTTVPTFLVASCATHTPSASESRAMVLSYGREYPAYPPDHPVRTQRLVLDTFSRALDGDHHALARIYSDYDTFGSGDCEAWDKTKVDILRAVGDKKFAGFVASRPVSLQRSVLGGLVATFGITEARLQHEFPATAKLYSKQ